MKVYELTTLNDVFNKVPAEKIHECMSEIAEAFTHAALMRDSMIKLMESAGIEYDRESILRMDDMHSWVDDGLGNIDIEISVSD